MAANTAFNFAPTHANMSSKPSGPTAKNTQTRIIAREIFVEEIKKVGIMVERSKMGEKRILVYPK